jgi:hypothetical protein
MFEFGNGCLIFINHSKLIIQKSISYCAQPANKLWLGLWVKTSKTSSMFLGVGKYLVLRTGIQEFYNYLYTMFLGFFDAVGVSFITSFHSTYKGNYKVYKLIIVIR